MEPQILISADLLERDGVTTREQRNVTLSCMEVTMEIIITLKLRNSVKMCALSVVGNAFKRYLQIVVISISQI